MNEEMLWEILIRLQGNLFYTAKGLSFSYYIRGNEMFVDRKRKSITRATVIKAFHTAAQIRAEGGRVKGPKMLSSFGASYLYPIFQRIGVID